MGSTFGIGEAIKEMQFGNRVRRAGWNGKNMWLAYCDGTVIHPENAAALPGDVENKTLPFILMRTAGGELVPWLCSQTDLLAVDWELAA